MANKELKRIGRELNEICKEPGVKVRATPRKAKAVAVHARAEEQMVNRAASETARAFRGNMKAQEALLRALDEEAAEQPPGSLLLVRKVRKRARLEKDVFDEAALALAQRYFNGESDAVVLHYHDWPASLKQSEREEMIRDKEGTYYIGIARAKAGGLPKVEAA